MTLNEVNEYIQENRNLRFKHSVAVIYLKTKHDFCYVTLHEQCFSNKLFCT